MTTLDTIFTDADHRPSCRMTSIFPSSHTPSPLAPTSVGVSIEDVSVLRASHVRVLDAGRWLQGGPAPLTPSLAVKGSCLVAVSAESGMHMWRVLRGLGAGSVSSVSDVQRLRTFAVLIGQKGVEMAYPTPRTLRVVEKTVSLKLKMRTHFMRDGVICPMEQTLLDDTGEILGDAEAADEGRKQVISMLNMGDITEWQQRKWRERHAHFPDAA